MADLAGAVPRVEYQRAHREFLDAVAPPAAMINVVHLRRALKNGHTADSLFPEETTVVTTTTVQDDELADLTWDQEAALVTAFGPDYHVPTDYPVYGAMDAADRVENVKQCGAGTLYLAEELPEAVTVLPLLKGVTQVERSVGARAVAELDAPGCAFYATQFFTVPGARQFYGVRDRLEAIHEETDGCPVLVIGFMSPSDSVENREQSLRGLPESVTAAAGMRTWVERVEPRSSSPEEMRAAYAELAEEVEAALAAPAVTGGTASG